MSLQEIALVAAGMSALAAVASATAAWRVPHAVAAYAEKARQEGEARARKLAVLETLMQHRAMIAYPSSVAALNSIPMVFAKASEVRGAFDRFMSAANEKPFSNDRLRERHLGIINAIVRELGLQDKISAADVDEAYYPELLGRAHAVEAEEVIRRSSAFEPAANNAPTFTGDDKG